jgi:hypothetical protein
VQVHKLPREVSDHNPLIISTRQTSVCKRRDFRFESSWLCDPECLMKIQEIWEQPTKDENVLDRVLFKLKKVKKILKGWGFNKSGDLKRRKKEINEEILDLENMEEVAPLSIEQVKRRNALKVELWKILDEEEKYWHKRCHETWMLKGDNNTDCFHKVANGKKRKQTIFSLNDGDKRIVGDDDLLKHATEYYKKLFGQGSGNYINVEQDLWPHDEKVKDEENAEVIGPFSEEEVKRALFQMERNKAAGPDGLPVEFFQKN